MEQHSPPIDKTRLGVLAVKLDQPDMTKEARDELLSLLDHLNKIHREAEDRDSEGTQFLRRYYASSDEERHQMSQKLKSLDDGIHIDNNVHLSYIISDTACDNPMKPTMAYKDIVGYLFYHDDNREHNPIISIGEMFITKVFRQRGAVSFYRTAVNNLMDSLADRVPLFKVDALTHNIDDLALFVSLNYSFTQSSETVVPLLREEIDKLGASLIQHLKDGGTDIDAICDQYNELLDEHQLFPMYHITQCCHSCQKKRPDVELDLCNRCHTVLYCSRECQKKAWPLHKPVCNSQRL